MSFNAQCLCSCVFTYYLLCCLILSGNSFQKVSCRCESVSITEIKFHTHLSLPSLSCLPPQLIPLPVAVHPTLLFILSTHHHSLLLLPRRHLRYDLRLLHHHHARDVPNG